MSSDHRGSSPVGALAAVDPRGPVFISYRQSDGTPLAVALAWALRAAGVPVWHDQSDLPPGDTHRRLQEALTSGLSGAILLITPEIAESAVVREVELPQLLELESDSSFTLSVASTIEREPGKLDYSAPDRLLGQAEGTLQRLDQQPVATATQRGRIAAAQCRRRMEQLRGDVKANAGTVTLDVQTRIPPFAGQFDAHLVLRLRPPVAGQRRPHPDGLHDLGHFLGELPRLVAIAGAEQIRVRGGAHLTAAFALGAALPTTLIGRIDVLATDGATWSLSGQAPVGDHSRLLHPVAPPSDDPMRGPIVVYLDLLPQRSDAAVHDFVDADVGRFAELLHLRPTGAGLVNASDAAVIVGEAADAIRASANRHATVEVHVLLRCPYPVALLLGRTLNTLTVHLYEWEDGPSDGTPADPRYTPSLVVRSGVGGSPIQAVTAPPAPYE